MGWWGVGSSFAAEQDGVRIRCSMRPETTKTSPSIVSLAAISKVVTLEIETAEDIPEAGKGEVWDCGAHSLACIDAANIGVS